MEVSKTFWCTMVSDLKNKARNPIGFRQWVVHNTGGIINDFGKRSKRKI